VNQYLPSDAHNYLSKIMRLVAALHTDYISTKLQTFSPLENNNLITNLTENAINNNVVIDSNSNSNSNSNIFNNIESNVIISKQEFLSRDDVDIAQDVPLVSDPLKDDVVDIDSMNSNSNPESFSDNEVRVTVVS